MSKTIYPADHRQVGGAVTGIETWRIHFGKYYAKDNTYVIPVTWQYAYNAGGSAAMLLAALATGPMMDRLGRKVTLMLASVIWIAGAVLQYSAKDIAQYTGGKILTSLVQGMYLTISPSYVSEVAPTKVRGAFLSSTNFFIVVGQFLGTLVQRATDSYAPGPKSYQILFAVQWGFGAVIFLGAFFLPESPDWCLRHMEKTGGTDETRLRRTLRRLYGSSPERIDYELNRLRTSLAIERQEAGTNGSATYFDCFRSTDLRRTLISITPPLVQVLCGCGYLVGYQTYFLQVTGIAAASKSYTITLANYGIYMFGSLIGLLVADKLGRRSVFLWGCYALMLDSLLIGIVGEIKTTAAGYVLLVLLSIWGLVYQATLGPIGWAIASESSARRLRSKTISLVTMSNAFGNLVFYFINPILINPDQANMGTKGGFLYGGIMIACSLYSFLTIPEMKGRSYEELDEMFARRVKTRQFETYATSQTLRVGSVLSRDTAFPVMEKTPSREH